MKTISKLMLAGAALAAGGVVNAATISVLPTASTGSDLVLFVTDTSNNATFVQDLGVTVNSLGVTTASVLADSNASNELSYNGNGTIGTLSNPIGTNGVDSALATFISAQGSGQSFVYGILGAAQGSGAGSGQQRIVGSFDQTPAAAVNGKGNIGSLYQFGPSSSNVSGYVGGVTSYFSLVNAGTATPYGAGASSTSGKQAAGIGGYPADAALGAPVYLYELSSYSDSSSDTDANFYGSGVAITISTAGVISGFSAASSGTVPLPAAVWLFGSGLLGMFGIRRRRVENTAVVAA